MARLSEIAKAIEDDMATSGHELPEIASAQCKLRLIVEVEVEHIDPALYARLNKRHAKLVSR